MTRNSEDILQTLNEIVENVLRKKNINLSLNMSAKDIEGWDSLAHVQIIYNCEVKFKLRFTLVELGGLNTIKDLVDVISQKLKR